MSINAHVNGEVYGNLLNSGTVDSIQNFVLRAQHDQPSFSLEYHGHLEYGRHKLYSDADVLSTYWNKLQHVYKLKNAITVTKAKELWINSFPKECLEMNDDHPLYSVCNKEQLPYTKEPRYKYDCRDSDYVVAMCIGVDVPYGIESTDSEDVNGRKIMCHAFSSQWLARIPCCDIFERVIRLNGAYESNDVTYVLYTKYGTDPAPTYIAPLTQVTDYAYNLGHNDARYIVDEFIKDIDDSLNLCYEKRNNK